MCICSLAKECAEEDRNDCHIDNSTMAKAIYIVASCLRLFHRFLFLFCFILVTFTTAALPVSFPVRNLRQRAFLSATRILNKRKIREKKATGNKHRRKHTSKTRITKINPRLCYAMTITVLPFDTFTIYELSFCGCVSVTDNVCLSHCLYNHNNSKRLQTRTYYKSYKMSSYQMAYKIAILFLHASTIMLFNSIVSHKILGICQPNSSLMARWEESSVHLRHPLQVVLSCNKTSTNVYKQKHSMKNYRHKMCVFVCNTMTIYIT